MKKFLLFALLLSSFAAFAADKKVEIFTLDHQMSAMCRKKITENLRFEKGVSKIDVSLEKNTITIAYDAEKTDTDKLIAAFRKIGFNASVVGGDKKTAASCCRKETAASDGCKKAEKSAPCSRKKDASAACCRKNAAPAACGKEKSAACSRKKEAPASCCKK